MANLIVRVCYIFTSTILVVAIPQFANARQTIETAATLIPNISVVESAGLNADLDVPWSKPVQIKDPFEGSFLGVFDRNDLRGGYSRSSKIISLWSRDSIRMLLVANQEECGHGYFHSFDFDCDEIDTPRIINKLSIKVGDRVFEVAGNNSKFTVSEEIATALKNAPAQNVDIRLVLEDGETIDTQIGKETVQTWQKIY
ncbi:MAG: hypothetical protein ACRC2R_20215 [Xenococcaceae cyanobacterium]